MTEVAGPSLWTRWVQKVESRLEWFKFVGSLILSLATFVVAGVTGILAWETKKLAEATSLSVDQGKASQMQMAKALALANQTALDFKELLEAQKDSAAANRDLAKAGKDAVETMAETVAVAKENSEIEKSSKTKEPEAFAAYLQHPYTKVEPEGGVFHLEYYNVSDWIDVDFRNSGDLEVERSLVLNFVRASGLPMEPCRISKKKRFPAGSPVRFRLKLKRCFRNEPVTDGDTLRLTVDVVE